VKKRVVLLVDDKNRDLMMAALLAWHLKRRGIDCFLEPLEAYRGALAAHRPNLMVFNHIVASHLVEYSKSLGAIGVLTAVLLNEGLCYDDGVRDYNAGKHHKGAHIDYFFCWNQPLKEALERYGFGSRTHIDVAGPPRYDFYCKPWSRAFDDYRWPVQGRSKVLVCSNFGLAKFFRAPPAEGKRLFAAWAERIPAYRDWRGIIQASHRAQQRFLLFLDAIVRSRKFDVVFRPHPREDLDLYRKFLSKLPAEVRRYVHLDSTSNITSLILACELQVGCENCNTTLESWIAGKPTVELIFERHPVFYSPAVAALSPNCEKPEDVVATIERELIHKQERYAAGRSAHLAKWCAGAGGNATERIADIIAARLAAQPEPDWSRLGLADRRRGLKLKALQKLGKAYHYKPLLGLRGRVLGGRHKLKAYNYAKAVTPKDVKQALALLDSRLK
jgi:surface carbohydrate biosynthesis protein